MGTHRRARPRCPGLNPLGGSSAAPGVLAAFRTTRVGPYVWMTSFMWMTLAARFLGSSPARGWRPGAPAAAVLLTTAWHAEFGLGGDVFPPSNSALQLA